jgi:DNA-binding transcriptional regulator YdaS (Cro superfamily)
MARAMGVSDQYVSQIMNGHRRLPEKYIPALKHELGIPKKLLKKAA